MIINLIRKFKRAFVYSLPEKLWVEYFVSYLYYIINIRKFPNLKNPKNFNEKTLWRRFNERNINFCKYVDKFEVRSHIKKVLGNEFLIPLIGVYSSVDEIDFAKAGVLLKQLLNK